MKINPLLVPEFPIKKKGNNQSTKVDYLALQEPKDGEPAKQAFLVELKTDMASIDRGQLCDLLHVAKNGLESLVKGVIDICDSSTKQKRKYAHLLKLLSFLDLVGDEEATFLPNWDKQRWGYSELIKRIRSKVEERKDWPDLKLVYVAPKSQHKLLKKKEIATIDFKCFAATIDKGESDGIRRRFACYLKWWADQDAGSPNPKN